MDAKDYELVEGSSDDHRLLATYENQEGEQATICFDVFGYDGFEGANAADEPCTWEYVDNGVNTA